MLADVADRRQRVVGEVRQYLSLPNGGEARVSVIPLAGSQWSVPAKMKISMMPSQKVGIANPTYENTVAPLSNIE